MTGSSYDEGSIPAAGDLEEETGECGDAVGWGT
jgi:hypothetical protein